MKNKLSLLRKKIIGASIITALSVVLIGGGTQLFSEDNISQENNKSTKTTTHTTKVKKKTSSKQEKIGDMSELFTNIWHSTGIYDFVTQKTFVKGLGRVIMILVGLLLIFLGIVFKLRICIFCCCPFE